MSPLPSSSRQHSRQIRWDNIAQCFKFPFFLFSHILQHWRENGELGTNLHNTKSLKFYNQSEVPYPYYIYYDLCIRDPILHLITVMGVLKVS